MANEIYDSTWWGNTIDTASSIGTSTEMIQGQFNLTKIGEEKVVNGDFATDTDWSKSANTTISGGQATFAANGVTQSLIQANAWTADSLSGKKVQLTYTIISNSLNAGDFRIGGITGASAFDLTGLTASVGTYIVILNVRTSAGTDNAIDFYITSGATSGTLVIDNVSVKEVRASSVEAVKCLADAIHRIGIQNIQN
jgi:hypothetical protein